jgi:NAD(P)-dependent dehydrogenase (short-subunit alcohol dehydrogenase family)
VDVEDEGFPMRTVPDMIRLAGRRALLTGGAGHIGLAVAETLLELGASVSILDREADAVHARAEALCGRFGSGRVFPRAVDLGDEQATRSAVRQGIRDLDGLGILIHCAAYVGTTNVPGWAVPFKDQTVAAWDAAMRVNLTAAFVMAQEAHEALVASGHGSVILFSSIYGMAGPDLRLYEGTPMANPSAYGVSKAGLLELVRHLATVWAPQVRVNAISPGGVWRNQPQAFVDRYEARTPLGRMAAEEDIKGAVAYLAGDLSAYVTGHNLVVDGGWTAW